MRTLVASSLAHWTDKTLKFSHTLFELSKLVFNRISPTFAGILLLALCFGFFEIIFPTFTFGESKPTQNFVLSSPVQTTTKTLFTEEVVTKKQKVTFTQKTIVDETLKEGETKQVQAGSEGEKVYETTITYHDGAEYARETELLSSTPAVAEIIAVSPPKETVETPSGALKFTKKLTVWATAYDPNCRGCSGITYTGLKAGFGIIAVDPKVIPLGTKVWIPEYGMAVAGDIGGAVKGNKIDLGFANVAQSGWKSHFTEIYLLTD